MTPNEAIDEARRTLDDVAEPFLWSDGELRAWLQEALIEACDRARLIRTQSNLAIKSAKRTYSLGVRVVDVDKLIDPSRGALVPSDEDTLDDADPLWRTRTGQPDFFFLDETTLWLDKEPTADATYTIIQYLIPEFPLQDGEEIPIHMRHHFRLLDWIFYRAYRKRDSQTQNERLAESHRQQFRASFGDRPSANVLRKRRERRAGAVEAIEF